jgi:hypothetical protein
VFRRTDLAGSPPIPARLSQVRATDRRTALGEGDAPVETVEHLLAAAAALQIDDLTVELDGPEPPIGDGSFAPYLDALRAAGIAEQPGEPVVYRVTAPFHLTEGDATYVVAPAPALRLTTTVEWAHPLIGRQSGSYDITPDGFARERAARPSGSCAGRGAAGPGLASARRWSRRSSSPGRLVGGALRWPDEFVSQGGRHRGRPRAPRGRCRPRRRHKPSHQQHRAGPLAASHRTARRRHVMDIGRISTSYPTAIRCSGGRIIEVEDPADRRHQNVTINEPFFQGHFPGTHHAGVLIIGRWRRSGYAAPGTIEDPDQKVVTSCRSTREFRRPCCLATSPLRAGDAAEPGPHLPDEGRRLRGRQRGGGGGDDGAGGGQVTTTVHPTAIVLAPLVGGPRACLPRRSACQARAKAGRSRRAYLPGR